MYTACTGAFELCLYSMLLQDFLASTAGLFDLYGAWVRGKLSQGTLNIVVNIVDQINRTVCKFCSSVSVIGLRWCIGYTILWCCIT